MFRCESETTLFWLPKEDPTKNHWLSFIYNTVPEQFKPNISVCSAFYGGLFPEPGRRAALLAGLHKGCFYEVGQFQLGLPLTTIFISINLTTN